MIVHDLTHAIREATSQSDLSFLQKVRIRIALILPRQREAVLEGVANECCAEGFAIGDGSEDAMRAINWDAIIEFIKKLLPLILEIIKLFR